MILIFRVYSVTRTEGGDGLLGNSFTVAPVCVLLCHVSSAVSVSDCLSHGSVVLSCPALDQD